MSTENFKSESGSGCKSSAESIGVHSSQSSRMSRDKLKSDPVRDKIPEESIGVHRIQSSGMSRDKLKSEAG
jgi:hypothetical protein